VFSQGLELQVKRKDEEIQQQMQRAKLKLAEHQLQMEVISTFL
jgi:hypothetical protein